MRPDPHKPPLTEADLFFELFLPTLLESRAAAMEHFKFEVELRLLPEPGAEPTRVWTVRGGARPWLSRGPATAPAVVCQLTLALVNRVVQGRPVDVAEAISSGELVIGGRVDALESLGLTFDEARGLLATLLRR